MWVRFTTKHITETNKQVSTYIQKESQEIPYNLIWKFFLIINGDIAYEKIQNDHSFEKRIKITLYSQSIGFYY